MQQADDFCAESEKLFALVALLDEPQMAQSTGFKNWTISDIIRHLHVWNEAATLSLNDIQGFTQFLKQVQGYFVQGGDLRQFERARMGNLDGKPLLQIWRTTYLDTAAMFVTADPSARVPWVGPSMSARSAITARLMESWAHGQAVFDVLGVERINGDALRNIATLGFNTCGWTFRNRGEAVPERTPFVKLTAPSGDIWTFGEPDNIAERISGDATQFCQVVTQTRNIADTQLLVKGAVATRWMRYAQCFAGAPNDPPPPGSRRINPPRKG